MEGHYWKLPKDKRGELRWRNGATWQDVFVEVSASTIIVYPKNKENLVLKTIYFTQISEIKKVDKILRKSFQIFLKNGESILFMCYEKGHRSVQSWIDSLTYSKKFWDHKEIINQRPTVCPKKLWQVPTDDTSLSRIFITLWNGELVCVPVSNTSTFTDVYPRILSSCQDGSCYTCKLRHQSSKLWAVDTSGTKRLVASNEILLDLCRQGNQLFVLEHGLKLLIVHFSDVSYEILPTAAAITAEEVLKLEAIATKLHNLGCLNPGLFLKIESGAELLFQNNEQPFKYPHGNLVARSKAVRVNSKKKSKEIIAELRWTAYIDSYRRKKIDDVLKKTLADQIQKFTNCNDEVDGLYFRDDHFALENDSRGRSRTGPPSILYLFQPTHTAELSEQRNYRESGLPGNKTCDPEKPPLLSKSCPNPGMKAGYHSSHMITQNVPVDPIHSHSNRIQRNPSSFRNNRQCVDTGVDSEFDESSWQLVDNADTVTSLGESSQEAQSSRSERPDKRSEKSRSLHLEKQSSQESVQSPGRGERLSPADQSTLDSRSVGYEPQSFGVENRVEASEITKDEMSTDQSQLCGTDGQNLNSRAGNRYSTKTTELQQSESSTAFRLGCDQVVECSQVSRDLSSSKPWSQLDDSSRVVTDGVETENEKGSKPVVDGEIKGNLSETSGEKIDNGNERLIVNQTRDCQSEVATVVDTGSRRVTDSPSDVRRDSNELENAECPAEISQTAQRGSHETYHTRKDNLNTGDLPEISRRLNTETQGGSGTIGAPGGLLSQKEGSSRADLTGQENIIGQVRPTKTAISSTVPVSDSQWQNGVKCLGRISKTEKTLNSPDSSGWFDFGNVGDGSPPFIPDVDGIPRSVSDSYVLKKARAKNQKKLGSCELNGLPSRMIRSISEPDLHYASIDSSLLTTLATSEPDLNDNNQSIGVGDVFEPKESSEDSDDEAFTCSECSKNQTSSSGVGWEVAKRVQNAVERILAARSSTRAVNDIIASALCPSLLEILDNGLKKSSWSLSRLFKSVDVWYICRIISGNTREAKRLIEETEQSNPRKKFLHFVRACIRANYLSNWFELLRETGTQERISEFYEQDALVLGMADLPSMEHLTVFLDKLIDVKLADEKRQKKSNDDFVFSFE